MTIRDYWAERKERTIVWANKPIPYQFQRFTKEGVTWHEDVPPVLSVEEQQTILNALTRACRTCYGGTAAKEPFIEVRGEEGREGQSIRFQIRKAWNPFIRSNDIRSYYTLCSQVRKELNVTKKFRTCKVFMLIYEEEEMISLNVVYNPRWRRYENFDLMYRSRTQLARARR